MGLAGNTAPSVPTGLAEPFAIQSTTATKGDYIIIVIIIIIIIIKQGIK